MGAARSYNEHTDVGTTNYHGSGLGDWNDSLLPKGDPPVNMTFDVSSAEVKTSHFGTQSQDLRKILDGLAGKAASLLCGRCWVGALTWDVAGSADDWSNAGMADRPSSIS